MTADGTQLKDLVEGIPIAMVATQGPHGLCGRPLAVQRVDDDGGVWFLVDRHADWVTDDLGEATISFVDTTTWVSANGPATTTADPAVIEDLGDPVTDTWFEDGAEPVALRVSVGHADWWDAPGRLRQVVALAGAKITGHQPDMGDRGTASPDRSELSSGGEDRAVRAVATDRTDVVAVPVPALWAVVEDVDGYPSFWPWLRAFDGRELRAGVVWRGVIDVAGPFRLAVSVHVETVDPGRSVTAHLGGDLSGTARVEVAGHPRAALHLCAALVPERAALRRLTRWARPLAQASHDRVIARAVAQLAAHAERLVPGTNRSPEGS